MSVRVLVGEKECKVTGCELVWLVCECAVVGKIGRWVEKRERGKDQPAAFA